MPLDRIRIKIEGQKSKILILKVIFQYLLKTNWIFFWFFFLLQILV